MTRHYLYNTNYPSYEEDLCKLEMRALFNKDIKEKNIISTVSINPSVSPFMRSCLEILKSGEKLDDIIDWIIETRFGSERFLVKYVMSDKEVPSTEQKSICKRIGYDMEGYPNFKNPDHLFGITYYKNKWYFGHLRENNMAWLEHNNKPFSYSSALNIRFAKVLVNLATCGDVNKRIIDPCCGVGTVILEGMFSGYDVVGYDIISKVAEHATENLLHFGYDHQVKCQNINTIEGHYDASIIDLPYGILSATDKENQMMIVKEAKRLSDRVIVVSKEEIDIELINLGLTLVDKCSVRKSYSHNFMRYIWICE
jgi:tRNA G10  N-methylase Trm11